MYNISEVEIKVILHRHRQTGILDPKVENIVYAVLIPPEDYFQTTSFENFYFIFPRFARKKSDYYNIHNSCN